MNDCRREEIPEVNDRLAEAMNAKKPVFIGKDGLIYDAEQAGELKMRRNDYPLTQLKDRTWMR